jgi:hypothetical protein
VFSQLRQQTDLGTKEVWGSSPGKVTSGFKDRQERWREKSGHFRICTKELQKNPFGTNLPSLELHEQKMQNPKVNSPPTPPSH